MKKILGVALTEKGVLKPSVRTAIKNKDVAELQGIIDTMGFEYCADKNAFVLTRSDANGNEIYTVLSMTVSTTHPSNLAERKGKPKKASVKEEIEIE